MKIKKKIVSLDNDKTRSIMRAFLDALNSNGITNYDSIVEVSKKSAFMSLVRLLLPKGLEGSPIDALLNAKEYVLSELDLTMDDAAELFYQDYIYFWHNLLKENGVEKRQIVDDKISDHNILIFELLKRICADALSINMSIENHDGEILLKTMHSFVDNLKNNYNSIMDEKTFIRDEVSKVGRFLGTDHEVWMDWMNGMVDSIKAIHESLQTFINLQFYLNRSKLALRSLLMAELGTAKGVKEIDTYHFDEEIIETTLRELEFQCIDLGKGYKRLDSKSHARLEENRIMGRSRSSSMSSMSASSSKIMEEDTISARSVVNALRILNEPSALVLKRDGAQVSKADHVSMLYALLEEAEMLRSIVTSLKTLDSTMGWVAIMIGAVKLDVVQQFFDKFALRREKTQINRDADIFNTKIGAALIRNNATSDIRLTKLGGLYAGRLKKLQNPESLKRVLNYAKGAFSWLMHIQSVNPYGLEFLDANIYNKLIGEIEALIASRPRHERTFVKKEVHSSSTSHAVAVKPNRHVRKSLSSSKIHAGVDVAAYSSKRSFLKSKQSKKEKLIVFYPSKKKEGYWTFYYFEHGKEISKNKTNDELIVNLLSNHVSLLSNQSGFNDRDKELLLEYALNPEERANIVKKYLKRKKSKSNVVNNSPDISVTPESKTSPIMESVHEDAKSASDAVDSMNPFFDMEDEPVLTPKTSGRSLPSSTPTVSSSSLPTVTPVVSSSNLPPAHSPLDREIFMAYGRQQLSTNKHVAAINKLYGQRDHYLPLISSITIDQLETLWGDYRATKLAREAKKFFVGIFNPSKVDISLQTYNDAKSASSDQERARIMTEYMLDKSNWHLSFCEFLWTNLSKTERKDAVSAAPRQG